MSDLDTTSTDAMHWAESFCQTVKEQDWTLADIDEGLMVGWFANYWAAVHDPLQRQLDEKQARIDELVEMVTIASEKQLDPPALMPHNSKGASDE